MPSMGNSILVRLDAQRSHFPLTVTGCTPHRLCQRVRVPSHKLPRPFAIFSFESTKSSHAIVPLSLTVRDRAGLLARGVVQVPVVEDYSARCGDYGGRGRVTVTADGRFVADAHPSLA